MDFGEWLKDSDKEVQSAVSADLDRAFDGSNPRKAKLFPHYLDFKILQEQKQMVEGQKKLVYQTWVLTIATWILAIITGILVVVTWLKS